MDQNQFEAYQVLVESKISDLSHQIVDLEKSLNMFISLLDASNYINKSIKNPNLLSYSNDVLLGLFGAIYSNIYLFEEGDVIVAKCTNTLAEELKYISDNQNQTIIDNHKNKNLLFNGNVANSILGVPITLKDKTIGYVIVCHTELYFFNEKQIDYLSLLVNQLAIAIDNNKLYFTIQEMANRDGLTNLYNKSFFFKKLNSCLSEKCEYAIIMCDIDNFKMINDKYGHLFGDKVLVCISNIIAKEFEYDSLNIVSRYGGEEIIIFVKDISNKHKILEKITLIQNHLINLCINDFEQCVNVTLSYGIYFKEKEKNTLDECIHQADKLLYFSKRTGKNKVSTNIDNEYKKTDKEDIK